MAQKFEFSGGYAWNVEQCEELLLIAGYEEIYRYIPADQPWKHEFETHFFEIGDGVAAEFVEAINAVRKRCELEVIVIRETNLYEYGRSPDKRIKSRDKSIGLTVLRSTQRGKCNGDGCFRPPPLIRGRRILLQQFLLVASARRILLRDRAGHNQALQVVAFERW